MSDKTTYQVSISFSAAVQASSKKKAITEFMENVLPILYKAGDFTSLDVEDNEGEDV